MHLNFAQGRSISTDNLLVRTRDLLPKCFAPTNIFALIEMHPDTAMSTKEDTAMPTAEDTAMPFPYCKIIDCDRRINCMKTAVGTQHCCVLTVGNINSDPTGFDMKRSTFLPIARIK